MSKLTNFCLCLYFLHATRGSTLTTPPQSAVVVGFENVYDLSLLANTVSDQGIYSTLIVPANSDIYDNLIDVEVIRLNVSIDATTTLEAQALRLCEILLTDQFISNRISEIQPTFTIFPALRHDGCLLPWARFLQSIPVVYTGNTDEEFYTLHFTATALPIHNGDFWSRFFADMSWKSISAAAKDSFAIPALRLAGKHLRNVETNLENFYEDVRLVLWGSDTILRSDFASLTQMLVEVGCHHCRVAYPLPDDLQKLVVEYRLGTVVVLLDETYQEFVEDLARNLPQGRPGEAVVWKTKEKELGSKKPENLFIKDGVDRQDLIGYARTRVLLSHCADTELLETAFHGTPVICFPRNAYETRNTRRAIQLGFARSAEHIRNYKSASEIVGIVSEMHETLDYRERARKVSLAIRDRLNPAVDRLIYWLRYLARTNDDAEDFLSAKSHPHTFAEDFQFMLGLFVGNIIGIVLGIVSALGCVFARRNALFRKPQRSKGKYAR